MSPLYKYLTSLIFSVLLVLTTLASCISKSDLQEDVSEDAGSPLHIELSLTESKYKAVTVTLKHNGSNRDKYIMFITDDMQTSPLTLCEEYLSEGNTLLDQKKKVRTFHNLFSDTEYRVIAVGVEESDRICSDPVYLEFITKPRTWEAVLNPSWKIYCFTVYPDDTITDTYTRVDVIVDDGVYERYCLLAVKYDYYLSFDDKGDMLDKLVSHILDGAVDDWWNSSDEFYTSSCTSFFELYDKEWVIVATGINEEEMPTGMYSVSEVISLNINDTAPKYSEWLGEWKLESTGEILTLDINMVNESFSVSGFRNIEDNIIVNYDLSSNIISVPCQYIGMKSWGIGDDKESYSYYLRGLFQENKFFPEQYDYDIADGNKQDNIICLKGNKYEGVDMEGIYESMAFIGKSFSSDTYKSMSNIYSFPLILHRYDYE